MADHNIPRSGDSPFRSAADKATSIAWGMPEGESNIVLFKQPPPHSKKEFRDNNVAHKKFYDG